VIIAARSTLRIGGQRYAADLSIFVRETISCGQFIGLRRTLFAPRVVRDAAV
jgi:hypothetical protein